MTQHVHGVRTARAGDRDGGVHRVDQVAGRAQPAGARAELVAGKVERVDAEAVTGQERAQRIEVVLGARVAVAGDDRHVARAARFVGEHRDLVRTGRRSQQLEVHFAWTGRTL